MRAIGAMVRAGWQVARTYRVALFSSVLSLFLTIIPLYFVATALQPTMANVIRAESSSFFAFTFLGMMVVAILPTCVNTLGSALGGGISTGTLEMMLTTPTRTPQVLIGLVGYEFVWAVVRSMLSLGVGMAFGVRIALHGFLPGLGVLMLILAAYTAIGLGVAALILAFRSTGPIPSLILTGSALLGGVYFPTFVIPSWVERVSVIIPLSYGLRALRKLWLTDAPFADVSADVMSLTFLTVLFAVASTALFTYVLRDARRRGTLGVY